MFKKIGIGLAVVLALLVVLIATRPATFRVERSVTIQAPAEVVFAHINDFHQWEKWSPWEKLDPDQKRTFEGAPSGQGAIYRWAGNDRVGEGRMTVSESKPNERIALKLEFLKPHSYTSNVDFSFKPTADSVNVVWAMSGDCSFVAKAMSLFTSMDQMIGPDFEKGLVELKNSSEAEAKKRAEDAKQAVGAAR